MKKLTYILGLALASFLFASCGGEEQKEPKTEQATTTEQVSPAESALDDVANTDFEANDSTDWSDAYGEALDEYGKAMDEYGKSVDKAFDEVDDIISDFDW